MLNESCKSDLFLFLFSYSGWAKFFPRYPLLVALCTIAFQNVRAAVIMVHYRGSRDINTTAVGGTVHAPNVFLSPSASVLRPLGWRFSDNKGRTLKWLSKLDKRMERKIKWTRVLERICTRDLLWCLIHCLHYTEGMTVMMIMKVTSWFIDLLATL